MKRRRRRKPRPQDSSILEIVKPDPGWVDVGREARRWGVSEEHVTEAVKQVEAEASDSLEVQLKITRRNQELLTYLRTVHDNEIKSRKCTWAGCAEGPWETWGEMAAHVRFHLVMGGDEQVIARVLKDVDGLIHPKEQIEVKAKTNEGRAELLKRLTGVMSKQLALPPRVPESEGDVVVIDAEVVDGGGGDG